MGSEFNAAAHQANPGIANGVNSAKVSGTSSAGRQPAITCSARNSASDASSWPTSRLSAGSHHCSGASREITPATRNAPGITWPS